MYEGDSSLLVDSIRQMQVELAADKAALKMQREIIDRHAGDREGSRGFLKALEAVGNAERLDERIERLESMLKESEAQISAVLDLWYMPGTWQNAAAHRAAFSDLTVEQIAAAVGEHPFKVRAVVADVRRRLMPS